MKKKAAHAALRIPSDPAILQRLEKRLTNAVHLAFEQSPILGRFAKPGNGLIHGDSTNAASPNSTNAILAPSHEEIAVRAEALWREMGCPRGCDKHIWLAAERRLHGQLRFEREERDRKALLDQLSLINNVKMENVMEKLEELYPGQSGKETTSL